MAEVYKFTHSDYTTTIFKGSSVYDCGGIIGENRERDPFEAVPMYTQKNLRWDLDKSLFTEEEFVKNYGNPLASVMIYRPTVVVTKDDKKVAIKFFEYQRSRLQGKKYFRVSTKVQYITFNYITHSLYSGYIMNYHKKRNFRKKVNRNCFYDDSISRMVSMISSMVRSVFEKTPELLINNSIVNDIITQFINNIPNSDKYNTCTPSEVLYKLYLDGHKIKTPNNWKSFINVYPQPKKKDYVKHKLKFMDAFMAVHELQGDKIRRVLHQVNNVSGIEFLKFTHKFFGEDFIASQDDSLSKEIIGCSLYIDGGMMKYSDELSKNEKKNSFEIFRQVLRGEIDVNTYYDHFKMINQLRQFEPIKWLSNDYESFTSEHMSLTEKISFYTNGTFERIYGEEFNNRVQEPLNVDGIVYYPILLKTSDDYNMESFIQSNCVKGYVDRASSIIISLREECQDSKVRGTIEFNIYENNGEVCLRRTQTLGRFNRSLGDEWKKPLSILDLKIGKIVLSKLFELPKIILTIGYKNYSSESHFLETLYPHYDLGSNRSLSWVDSRILNRPKDTPRHDLFGDVVYNDLLF